MAKEISRRDLFRLAAYAAGLFLPPALTVPTLGLRAITAGTIPIDSPFALGVATKVLAACAPMNSRSEIPHISTPTGEIISLDGSHAPWAEFLSAATRYDPAFYEGLVNQKQADILATFFIENQKTSSEGIVALRNLAITEERCIGASGCIDTRLYLPDTFPNVENLGTDITQLLEKDNIFYSTPVYKIGAQPTIFQQNINQSFYVTHQTAIGIEAAECIESGCGLFAGIDTILRDPIGIEILKQSHGVSPATIDEMQRLIAMGNNADPVAWARAGARMQAEINYFAHGSQEVQYTAYGVYGHANDGFVASTEVIDNFGNLHSIDDFPMLKAYAAYMNQPHPIITAYTEGQAPAIVAINGSRVLGAEDIYGDLVRNKGITMPSEVDRIPGRPPISWEEAKRVSAGAFYGTSVLENDKVLIVTADNVTDLETLINFVKTEGVRTGNIQKFIDEGGIIVGTIVDETGKVGLANIINKETIGADILKLNIMRKGLIEAATREEFITMVKTNRLGAKLTEEQLIRLDKFYSKFRPFIPWLKFGAQVVGDFFTIKDTANFFLQKLWGQELIHEYTPIPNQIIFSPDYKLLNGNEYQQIIDRFVAIDPSFTGIDPYAASGLEGVVIDQARLTDAYMGAVNAWLSHGPMALSESEKYDPWVGIKDVNNLGKALILNIPVEIPSVLGEYTRPPMRLFTSLIIKPGIDDSGAQIYNPEAGHYEDQPMSLVDDATGLFTSLSPKDGPIEFMAVDERGFQYLMQAIPKPETKSFELRFVAPLGQQNQISLKDNVKKKFAKLKPKIISAAGSIFDASFKKVQI